MKYAITDLFTIEKLRKLVSEFHEATGLSASLVDTSGTILAKSGWQEICNRFHLANEKTAGKCLKKDFRIKERFNENRPHIVCKCPNGLYDAAAPVIVDGRHIAGVFAGQFLMFRPDISEIEQFSRQARRAGFNETDYLNALEKVPTLTPARVDDILGFLQNFAAMISVMAMHRKNQIDGKKRSARKTFSACPGSAKVKTCLESDSITALKDVFDKHSGRTWKTPSS